MCMANTNPKKLTMYCRNCKRLVPIDQASLICCPSNHILEENNDEIFTEDK